MKVGLLVLLYLSLPAYGGDVQVVERAEILPSAEDTIPLGGSMWKPVALPHNWYGDRVLTAPRVWYRLQVMASEPHLSQSIYMSRLWVKEIAVHVNGKQVWRTPHDWGPNGAPMTAVVAVIPPGLLRDGANTVHLRVDASALSFHGVPRIYFGETPAIRERAKIGRMLQFEMILPSMRLLGVAGLLALVFWVWTRRDGVLLWYGITGIWAFMLCELWYEVFYNGGSVFWQNALSALRFHGFLMPVLVMHLRLAGRRNPGCEALLWIVFAAAIASVAFPNPWLETAVAASAFLFLCMPALWILIVLSVPDWFRRPVMVALLLGDAVAALLYAQELGMLFGWVGHDLPRLNVYAPVAVMLAALLPAIQRVLAKVHAARREREYTEARLRQAEQERALAEQRRRIMADMHDGLGARLVALLSMAESGKVEARKLGEGIAAALEELRLAIDAAEPVEGDVNVVLGSVRHRMRTVLEDADVRLVWNVTELPAINDLNPQRILAIQRILLEVFTNIIKHSGAKTVFVSTARLCNTVEIAIEDDGRGFSSEAPNGGRGFGNLKMRSVQAGCTVNVTSSLGKGTRVAITLPAQSEASADLPQNGAARLPGDEAYPVLGMSHQRSSA